MAPASEPAPRSLLAARRVAAKLSQRQLAKPAGLSLSSIQRMEAGEDPKLRQLNNCALVLGCKLEALIEPAWREWLEVQPGKPTAPPDDAALAAARNASFKKSPGRGVEVGSRRWRKLPLKGRGEPG